MDARSRQRGVTIIELMTVVAVGAVLVAIAAPSLRDLMARQRLKSVTAELVTDLRYVRTIAMSRNQQIFVKFQSNASMSCYVIYMPSGLFGCDCLAHSPGQTCVPGPAAGGSEEIRTAQIPASTDIRLVTVPAPGPLLRFTPDGFPNPNLVLQASRISGGTGKTQVTINTTGRPTVCSPDDSVAGLPAC